MKLHKFITAAEEIYRHVDLKVSASTGEVYLHIHLPTYSTSKHCGAPLRVGCVAITSSNSIRDQAAKAALAKLLEMAFDPSVICNRAEVDTSAPGEVVP